MTLIIVFNAILGLGIVAAIVGGHIWAILSQRAVEAPAAAPAMADLPRTARLPIPASAAA